jgi:hypothetical protein
MKYVKFFLLNVIVFGSLITGISLLFPSVIHTNKTINISSAENNIVTKVNDVHTWKDWNSFSKLGSVPDLTTTNDSDAVSIAWDFNQDRNMKCEIVVYKTAGDSTPVNFLVTEKLKWYPWEKFRALVSDKAISNAIEQSLDKLKKQLEPAH